MRGLIGVVFVLLAASACSGDDEPKAEPSSSATTDVAEVRTLAETCPLVEQVTPTGLAPSESRVRDYQAELDRLVAEGDEETQNALGFMQDAVASTLDASPGSEYAAAFEQWTDALNTLAERCNAVGSGAFQG